MRSDEFTDIAHPPVSNTDELIEYLGGLADRMRALSEAFAGFTQWCRDAHVHRQVCERVEDAAGHVGEVSAHIATAEVNAEAAYRVALPDFARTP